jgi:signal transduction histidine kinase
MSRKTQIVLAITFMTAVLVSSLSYVYVARVMRQRLFLEGEAASNLAQQIAYLASGAVPDLSDTRINTNDPEAIRRALAYYLSTDNDLNAIVNSAVGNWPMISDAAIVDLNGKVILDFNPALIGKLAPDRPDFKLLQDAGFRRQLRLIYNPPDEYELRQPLDLGVSFKKTPGTVESDHSPEPFGSVRLGVSTLFLRPDITAALRHTIGFSAIAVLLSLVLAAVLSHVALGPLERINRSLDEVSAGHGDSLGAMEAGRDEYGLVTLKIAHLGRQMRDAREIFSALKDNVDQLMANLQDGLMLFTRDARVVLVSASVGRFLDRPRQELLGRPATEIFSFDSPLSTLVRESFQARRSIVGREVERANGRRVQVTLDFIQARGTPIGALLTLRDAESVRRIESEIETSRRISASGRVTRGVAHEVKNPINAIVLHLQLLQDKLRQIDPDTRRHMDIIGNELRRLDRVVQILVDFTRPRDLHLEELDLRRLLDDVLTLAAPEAEQRGVSISTSIAAEPLRVRIDIDSMKQAIWNVVLNGIQAMPHGGTLTIRARHEEGSITIEICDQGNGIPAEIQDKIFELYFTTKKSGSGIGLAQTYQVLQWNYGAVDFESTEGQGTTFRLQLPAVEHAEAENNRILASTLSSSGA